MAKNGVFNPEKMALKSFKIAGFFLHHPVKGVRFVVKIEKNSNRLFWHAWTQSKGKQLELVWNYLKKLNILSRALDRENIEFFSSLNNLTPIQVFAFNKTFLLLFFEQRICSL